MELQIGSREALQQIMVARYYSSSLGRFMAVDPGDDTQLESPQSWNKYAYVRNNPLRAVDPTGQGLAEAIQASVDFVGGVIRGAGASVSAGAAPGTAPSARDSGSSLLGQAVGSTAVAAIGAVVAGAGAAGGLLTAPTGVGAAAGAGAVVAGGAAVVGASANLAKITVAAGSLLQPGSNAGEGTPTAGGRPTAGERAAVNAEGAETGCHSCGATDPGTKSGNFVPDHQPPTAMNPAGGEQKLYPQCINCSNAQGGQVSAAVKKQQ